MKITSWNVNSLKARLDHVKKYLAENAPDVLMMQELKGEEFPSEDFRLMGYESVFSGQKAYNGVAILSKTPITVVQNMLGGGEGDEQARYLEVDTGGMRLINLYLPNGNPVESEKYPYKLAWMDRLKNRLAALMKDGIEFAAGGDYNIIPEDRDCFDPKVWQDDALFRLESRRKFRALLNLGLTDAFRVYNQAAQEYTFWDYQAGSWPKNNGIRIDHFLLSPRAADRLKSCSIDKNPRGWDKPSDHTPIMVELKA